MRTGRSTGYALLAIGHIAQNSKEAITLSHSISEKYKIPLEYLLKILQQLVRADVLKSKRGPRGGFTLAMPTSKITMLQIIEAVEGPLVGRLDIVESAKKDKFAVKAEKAYQNSLNQACIALGKVKLSDLL